MENILIRDSDDLVGDEDGDDNLSRPISKEVVLAFEKNQKNRKTAGAGGIIGELCRNVCKFYFILDLFVHIFNVLFDKGIFPENWTESIVLPLY